MNEKLDVAVLLTTFNRPEVTKKALNLIINSNPKKIYIHRDGPRKNNPEDIKKCKEVENIILNAKANCPIEVSLKKENHGLNKSMNKAISWFFENEEMGIILEDDILPNKSFYKFCSELLIRYRNNPEIHLISGFNPLQEWESTESYQFMSTWICWGWAGWRRSWRLNNNTKITQTNYKELPENIQRVIEKSKNKNIEIWWDLKLNLQIRKNKGKVIVPKNNLTTNMGLNSNATHNAFKTDTGYNRESKELKFPLIHQNNTEISPELELISDILLEQTFLLLEEEFKTAKV